MSVRILPWAVAAVVVAAEASRGVEGTAHAAEVAGASFDPSPDAIVGARLGSVAALSALRTARWRVDGGPAVSMPIDEEMLSDAGEGLAGPRALRLAATDTLRFVPPELATMSAERVSITLWARGGTSRPSVSAQYLGTPTGLVGPAIPITLALVPTGRATTDGWEELGSTPIDVRLAGTRLSRIFVAPRGETLLDLLEVRPEPGPATPDVACTSSAAPCGAHGTCLAGRCVDDTAVHGALLPLAMRRAYVARLASLLGQVQGDRDGAARALVEFVPRAAALAEEATTPGAFYGGLRELDARFVRAAHTVIESAAPSGLASLGRESVGACFMLADDDLGRTDGALSPVIAVSRVAPGSPFRVGDVVRRIDGLPVAAWVTEVAVRHPLSMLGLPDDPVHRLSSVASSLRSLLGGGKLVVDRCPSEAPCAPAQRAAVEVALADHAWAVLRGDAAPLPSLPCSARVRDAVPPPPGADPHGKTYAAEALDAAGIVSVQTNGMPGEDAGWNATVARAFDRGERLLYDARRGDGGGGKALFLIADRVRAQEGFGILFVERWGWESINGAPGALETRRPCWDGLGIAGCSEWRSHTMRSAPTTDMKRPRWIAWLNTHDASANDMAAAYAKGAPGVRIFAPHATEGMFGGNSPLPALHPNAAGGRIQSMDCMVGATFDDALAAGFQSGRGVEPDEVVIQRVSHLLAGRDTMLETARAWLLGQGGVP